jgi:uncharacterized membrane protein
VFSLPLGLIGINVYAALLVFLRARVYRTPLYRPMLLNIGLSIAPLVVLAGGLAVTLVAGGTGQALLVYALALLTCLVWLALLPNSSYLITELNMTHRKDGDGVPLWYDIVLVITLAMSGVFNTVVSIFLVKVLYASMIHSTSSTSGALAQLDVRALPFGVIALCAVGMYLGRYIRFNSWDLLHPLSFARKLGRHFATSDARRQAIGFTVTHAVFIGLVYVILAGTISELIGVLD